MPPRAEINKVIRWCRKKKATARTTPIIEINPFSGKYGWMLARIKIAIDLPLDDATPDMAVYDSPTDALYINVSGQWIKVEPDDIFEV